MKKMVVISSVNCYEDETDKVTYEYWINLKNRRKSCIVWTL